MTKILTGYALRGLALAAVIAVRRCRTFWKKAFENSALLG